MVKFQEHLTSILRFFLFFPCISILEQHVGNLYQNNDWIYVMTSGQNSMLNHDVVYIMISILWPHRMNTCLVREL